MVDLAAPLQFLQGSLLEKAEAVAGELAATANERDRRGGTALAERQLLRRSGLLAAWIAPEYGGLGASWPEVLDIVRLFARVDSSLAHIFGFQHLLLATSRLFGTPEQWQPLHRETAERRWFWGNALNPLDTGTTLVRTSTGATLNGKKSFSSGSVDADYLIVSALDSQTKKLVVLAIPPSRTGIVALGDWDNMGQRQTDSGTIEFHDVHVSPSEELTTPGPLGSTFASLRPLIAQLTLSNVYQGIAEGSLETARQYTKTSRRAWPGSGVETAVADPYVLHHYGDFQLALAGARALADQAAQALQRAFDRGDALTKAERGAAALAVSYAKVATTRAALDVTARIFDVTGARATSSRINLDRYWRNARTHTLHDPVDHKLREIGEYALTQQVPTPSFYS